MIWYGTALGCCLKYNKKQILLKLLAEGGHNFGKEKRQDGF